MESENKRDSSFFHFLAFVGLVVGIIGVLDINTGNSPKVTRHFVIIDDTSDSVLFYSSKDFSIHSALSTKKSHRDLDTLPSSEKIEEINEVVSDTVLVDSLTSKSLSIEVHTLSDQEFFDSLMNSQPICDRPNKKTIIRYYTKDFDEGKVYDLRKLGFYIHERPSSLKQTHYSNTLLLGDSVKNIEVLLVAYALMKNGVQLRGISLSNAHDDWKSHAIEVATDTTLVKNEILSLSYLRENWGDI